MERYAIKVAPSAARTRLLLTSGADELMRAVLPPPREVRHERAAATLLEGLALWLDQHVHVVLCADAPDASCCLGLSDELGCGVRSVFYDVEVAERGPRRRGKKLSGVADFGDLRQMRLWSVGGER
jgi:hypothetical protein